MEISQSAAANKSMPSPGRRGMESLAWDAIWLFFVFVWRGVRGLGIQTMNESDADYNSDWDTNPTLTLTPAGNPHLPSAEPQAWHCSCWKRHEPRIAQGLEETGSLSSRAWGRTFTFPVLPELLRDHVRSALYQCLTLRSESELCIQSQAGMRNNNIPTIGVRCLHCLPSSSNAALCALLISGRSTEQLINLHCSRYPRCGPEVGSRQALQRAMT